MSIALKQQLLVLNTVYIWSMISSIESYEIANFCIGYTTNLMFESLWLQASLPKKNNDLEVVFLKYT